MSIKPGGEFRSMRPDEIADMVRSQRELMGMKQVTLANQAGVNERTIQRLEEGRTMGEETLKAVALALGLAEESFIEERLLKSPAEAMVEVQKWFEKYNIVKLKPVVDWRTFDELLLSAVIQIDDSRLAGHDAERVVSIKEDLENLSDVADLMSPTERMSHAKDLFGRLLDILGEHAIAKYVTRLTSEGLKAGYLVLVPKGHKMELVDEAVMPNSQFEFISAEDMESAEAMASRLAHMKATVEKISRAREEYQKAKR